MPVNVGDLPCECVLQILSHQPVPPSGVGCSPKRGRSGDARDAASLIWEALSHPSERPASVSLSIASTASGIEISLESAPLAPASSAWAATGLARFAVNTRV